MDKGCRIALLAALPEESGPLKRLTGGTWRRISSKPFLEFTNFIEGKELILLETGMGNKRIQEALAHVYKRFQPDFLIDFGFAGSLSRDMPVGTVLLTQRFGLYDGLGLIEEEYCLEPSPELIRWCENRSVIRSLTVTVNRPQSKWRMSESLKGLLAVVDMESYFLARSAFSAQVPFLCFRAVSDGIGDEIDFDLDKISDESGRIRIGHVLLSALREPHLVCSFYDSWRRSRKAASRLGEVLAALLRFPVGEIRRLFTGSRFELRERQESDGL